MDFAAPAILRLAVALLTAGVGWGGVWLVEGRTPPVAVAAVVPSGPVTTRSVRLSFSASRPIATWAISSAGVVIAGNSDTTNWQGTAQLPLSPCDVLIEATPVDGSGPAWALRLRADGPGLRSDRTAWSPGPQVELMPIPAAP